MSSLLRLAEKIAGLIAAQNKQSGADGPLAPPCSTASQCQPRRSGSQSPVIWRDKQNLFGDGELGSQRKIERIRFRLRPRQHTILAEPAKGIFIGAQNVAPLRAQHSEKRVLA